MRRLLGRLLCWLARRHSWVLDSRGVDAVCEDCGRVWRNAASAFGPSVP